MKKLLSLTLIAAILLTVVMVGVVGASAQAYDTAIVVGSTTDVADIGETFINLEEFAEEHELGDISCPCVVQSPTARETFLSQDKYSGHDGVRGKTVVVHVAKDSLPEVPAEGQRLDLDGEILIVASCIDDMGMLSIELHGEAIG